MNLIQGFIQCRVTYWALVEMLLLSRLKMVINYFENRKFHATDKTVLGGLFFSFLFFPGLGGGKVGITIWEHLGNLMGTH
jgi:hypothetical protein